MMEDQIDLVAVFFTTFQYTTAFCSLFLLRCSEHGDYLNDKEKDATNSKLIKKLHHYSSANITHLDIITTCRTEIYKNSIHSLSHNHLSCNVNRLF